MHFPEPVSGSHSISTSNGKFVLQPLTEESEPEASGVNTLSPLPKNSTTSLLNSDYYHHHHTELFRDGENSENSDADFDLSDFDGTTEINGNGASGEDWRKAARRKLVAKAKRAVEEAEKLESMMGVNENGRRAAAPPIEVDFSDESEVEDDAGLTRSSNFRRDHRHSIPDEDGNLGTNGEVTAATNGTHHPMSRDVFVPLEDETDIPTATKLSFSAPQTPVPTDPLPKESEEKTPIEKDISPRSISPPTDVEATAATNGARYSLSNHVFVPPNDDTHIPTTTKPSFSASQTPAPTEPLPEEPEDKSPIEKDIHSSPISPPTMTLPSINQILKGSSTPVRAIVNGLPSPTSVGHHHNISSKHNNMTSSNSSLQAQPQQQQPNGTSVSTGSASIPVSTTVQGRNETPPMEWSIKEVIDWLKSKGFDQNTCDKFNGEHIIFFSLTQKKKNNKPSNSFLTNRTRNHRRRPP